MPILQTSLRAGALGLLLAGGGIYAVQADLLPSRTQATPVALASATPGDANQTPLSAGLPQDQQSPSLPDAPIPAPASTQLALLPDIPQPPVQQPALGTLGQITPSEPTEAASGTDVAQPQLSPFGLPCGLEVNAEATIGAMIALDISAPCQQNVRVTIGHSGLTLVETTDIGGLLVMDVPAFENPAFLTIDLEDGTSEQILVTVPDFDQYERVGIQWEGAPELQIHALEFGADYGDPGHRWQNNPGTADAADAGEGGFLTRLGADDILNPMRAEVYTFPRDTLEENGTIWLSVEAPITTASCGQALEAITLQAESADLVSILDLSFTYPDCDAVGDAVVLQNLFRDLRVAAN